MAKAGVLLANIGTPMSAEAEDVGRYLSEFLMDPYVIDIPFVFRWILVKLLIVPKRKFASSEAYKKIWTKEGSPLLVFSKRLCDRLSENLGSEFSVKIGMRYSQPSIQSALDFFKGEQISKILVLPMYPQFADSSSTTCIELVKTLGATSEVENIKAFYRERAFISSYAKVITENLLEKKVDHYLFSYHGLPERQIQRLHPKHCFQSKNCCDQISAANENCYRAQCVETTRLLAQSLGLKNGQFSFSFQSRLGRTKWIEPYTDIVIPNLAKAGIKKLAVICPSFVSDCLETLEEIGIRAKDDFENAGGAELYLIPCLNDHPEWVKSLAELIRAKMIN